MRRLTLEMRERFQRKSAFVMGRRAKITTLWRRKRAALLKDRRPPRALLVEAPTHLRYNTGRNNRKTFEAFLDKVDSCLLTGRQVIIDFRKTELLVPCGVLVLMGAIDEWVAKFPNQLGGKYPVNDLVEQMLQHIQVLEKLGLPARKTISHTDVTRWHYFTGKNVDASKVEPFMESLGPLLSEETQLGLGDCIAEALTNVKHHAYDAGSGGRWWIFATVSDGKIFVAIYDRGASIPHTLLAKPIVSDYLTGNVWARGGADGKLIQAACGDRTSTGLPYRGKGLPEMLNFTRNAPGSELGIFSRQGFFRIDNKEACGRLVKPLTGTLIIWMLSLSVAQP